MRRNERRLRVVMVLIVVTLVSGSSVWWFGQRLGTWRGETNTQPLPVADASFTVADSASQPRLQPRQRLGDGRSTQIRFDRAGTRMAVATDIGLYLYTTAALASEHFWPTSTPVQSVAITADGNAVAFSTLGEEQKLYQIHAPETEPAMVDLDASLVHGLHYSPDGSFLIGISFDQLFFWEAATLTLRTSHQQPGALTKHLSFTPDGSYMAILYKETLELWRLADQTLLQTVKLEKGHYFQTATVAFAADGKQLVAAGLRVGCVYRWRIEEEQLIAETSVMIADGNTSVTGLQFAPNGEQLAVGEASGKLYLYDLTAVDGAPTVVSFAGLEEFAWSADSSTLAVATADGTIHRWSVAEGAEVQSLPLPAHVADTKVTQLHFATPVSDTVVSDRAESLIAVLATGAVYHWQLDDGSLLAQLAIHSQGRLNSIAFTADGMQLVIGTEHGVVQLWDVARDAQLETLYPPAEHIDDVALNGEHQLAIAASAAEALGVWADPVYLWDRRGGPFTVLDTDDTGFVTTCGIYWNSAIFSADGQYLVTTAYAHKALLWRVADGALLQQFEGHTSAVLDIALSPDGSLLATASDDEEVRIWRMADGEVVKTLPGHAGGALAVAFAPDGASVVTRSAVGNVWSWPLADGAATQLLADVRNPRSNLAFSPDGAWLATGGRGHQAYLWRVSREGIEAMELYQLTGHNGLVNEVSFSPDGSLLATASDDGTVMLWDIPR